MSAKRKRYNLLIADQQTVIYYSTIQALELICFDSNTQETMKMQLYPSNSSNFPSLHRRIPQIFLTVTQTFTCITFIMRKNNVTLATLHWVTSMKHGRREGWRHKMEQLASRSSAQWHVTEWNMILFHWLYRCAVSEYPIILHCGICCHGNQYGDWHFDFWWFAL